MVTMALNATPTMNTRRNARCALEYRFVSKIERRSSLRPPMKEPAMANRGVRTACSDGGPVSIGCSPSKPTGRIR